MAPSFDTSDLIDNKLVCGREVNNASVELFSVSNKIHRIATSVDQGLNTFNSIGYHWLDEHAMQALGSFVFSHNSSS